MAIRAIEPARLVSEWGTFANAEYDQARKAGDTTAMSCWGADGACRAAGHGVIGGVLGGSGAAIGAGLSSLAGPTLAEAGAQIGLDPQTAAVLGATGLGALVGGASGAVGANNEIRNNFVGLIRLVQLGGEVVTRGGPTAVAALSAEVRAAMFLCASSTWCASLPLAAGAITWAKTQKVTVLAPSAADQIPGGGYGANPLPDYARGGTTTPGVRVEKPTVTVTPGDNLARPTGTGGQQIVPPSLEDIITATPIGGPETPATSQLTFSERATGGEIIEVNPADLRWTQTTAGGNGRADSLRESMAEHGYNGSPIDVVRMPSGIVTVDHTRAAVALEQGIASIPAMLHQPSERLPPSMQGRFGNAKTWGEAAEYRAARQAPPLPADGTRTPPRLPKPKH